MCMSADRRSVRVGARSPNKFSGISRGNIPREFRQRSAGLQSGWRRRVDSTHLEIRGYDEAGTWGGRAIPVTLPRMQATNHDGLPHAPHGDIGWVLEFDPIAVRRAGLAKILEHQRRAPSRGQHQQSLPSTDVRARVHFDPSYNHTSYVPFEYTERDPRGGVQCRSRAGM